ncbi:MAG TPA: hypothetical protein VF373_11760 [Prolixibacteraceae bacterium]
MAPRVKGINEGNRPRNEVEQGVDILSDGMETAFKMKIIEWNI